MDEITIPSCQSRECSDKSSRQAQCPSISLDAHNTTLQYNPITHDRHIRVLDLTPGSWDQAVDCSLRAVHLDDDELCYEAISYAWGDPTDRKTIICNGCEVSITRSLFEALQRLRCADTTRTLWADALCINQADNDERTSQVRLMSFIYKKAVRVLVWLQHEDDQVVQDSLNAICRFVLDSGGFDRWASPQFCAQQQSSQVLYKLHNAAVTSVNGEYSPESIDYAMQALRYICTSPWFGRGWVIQEVALANSVSVFWGHAEFDFEWLGIASSHYGPWWGSESFVSSRGMKQCFYLFQLSPSLGYPSKPRMSCFNVIRSTRDFTFSEPKDRIYGLLGLKTLEYDPADGHLLVDPDYNITTMDCYRRVAGKLLSEWHDFRVLSWIQKRTPKMTNNWPSWVPDWEQPSFNQFVGFGDDICEKIGKSSHTDISEICINGDHCIEISGYRVDLVDREVEEYVDLRHIEDYPETATRLQALLRSLEHEYDDRYLACTFANKDKAIPIDSVRIANLVSEFRIFMEKEFLPGMDLDEKPQLVLDAEPPFEPSAIRFLHQYLSDAVEHTLFITSKGMLGLGPAITLPGDVVVVLHGAPVPFVLRCNGDLWEFVGESYLYDINEGRIHREWEENGSVSEKFCLW